ncbi:MAG: glycosyltransferase [Cyanobacteriota bacterium]|nr:glycosyltransferase [Cyanobacteriota bacterium]
MQYTNLKEQNPKATQKLAKKRPIRILHVVGEMVRAGTETWLMHILRNIDRDTFQMDFLVHTNKECDYDAEIRALGSKVIPCLNSSQPWLYARNFQRILRDNEPYDIVHSHVHHFSGFVLWLAKLAGIPVRIAHSHLDSSVVESNSGFKRRLYTDFSKALIAKSATVGLAASHQALEDLFYQTQTTGQRWRLLLCGVNLKPFKDKINSEQVRAELGIPPDTFVVGHVGRFHPQKNHQFVIDIADEIAKREPKMRLLLVGEGELLPDIKHKVMQMGLIDKVIFAGIRSDVYRIMMGAMDGFLFPSLYEGLGLVLVEAQAAGLPCILSDVIPEEADIIKPLMQRMSLLQPASAWAETILSVRKTQTNITQQQALKSIEQSSFNIQTSLKYLENLYVEKSNVLCP